MVTKYAPAIRNFDGIVYHLIGTYGDKETANYFAGKNRIVLNKTKKEIMVRKINMDYAVYEKD